MCVLRGKTARCHCNDQRQREGKGRGGKLTWNVGLSRSIVKGTCHANNERADTGELEGTRRNFFQFCVCLSFCVLQHILVTIMALQTYCKLHIGTGTRTRLPSWGNRQFDHVCMYFAVQHSESELLTNLCMHTIARRSHFDTSTASWRCGAPHNR